MARNLRSSSHADSRPPTPATHTGNMASSFTESTRPRKQRRTGRTSRVGTDSLRETPVSSQSQSDQPQESATNGVNGTELNGHNADWTEPPPRAPVPSYLDTPWSNVSTAHNPVLGTMRPLGALPSTADRRKAGLAPSHPGTPSIPVVKEPQLVPNGEKKDDNPPTPLSPAEEQAPDPILPRPAIEEDLAAFTILPVPNSLDADVDTLKAAVESALHLASDANNQPVIKGLLRMWEKCGNDPYALRILDGVCQETPASPQKSMFQKVMRNAFGELESNDTTIIEPSAPPVPGRARSASSVSTLSSAKSLDAETYAPAPVVAPTSAARPKKGKQSKNSAQKKNLVASALDAQRQRASENRELSADAVHAKKSRLRKTLPRIVTSESGIRFSLTSNPPSNLSSPGLITPNAHISTPEATGPRRERSGSLASSDAGDNRRLTLTPSLTDDYEPEENNDFCRQCKGTGRLLCCDGCVYSYHFSCLDPPLDPANPPGGDWFCPKCSMSKSLSTLVGGMDQVNGRDFALPSKIRDFFTGVRTDDSGKYEEVASLPRINPRAARGSRIGRYDDPFLLRITDAKGKLIVCIKCGQTTNGRRPIIQCDFCPCAFHMDCIDPPLAVPPTQRAGSDRLYHTWMCPNHALHDMCYPVKDDEGYETMKRIRRPKNPRYVDIEILPEKEEEENLEDEEKEGITYRVSEKGIKLDFIQRVKRENENAAAKKAAESRYFEYAKSKVDAITAEAEAFFASQKPATDTTAAILNSRTDAEREAAANLISFAQSNHVTWQEEDDQISLLIDQLKANAPKDLPAPEDEISSLLALQKLIEQRISVLQPKPAESAQSAEV
ncbi:putative PHD finger domain protein [Aspergillus mulundensis]|uniref:PHD-type domain-containing protein n=1 Tax=Aspergillus mulundensis TaxID=1810919 RepID=A0A3D8RZB0_9EURO|nr:hypothetical protein DSM5745_06036 [Aspergillus mulundensis]RDW79184.1 hypothetical protein DSM5745_06036 [Aspergillus mulundensis]